MVIRYRIAFRTEWSKRDEQIACILTRSSGELYSCSMLIGKGQILRRFKKIDFVHEIFTCNKALSFVWF